MEHTKRLRMTLALALVVGGATTAFAQPIFDRAREDAERRAEHQAVREAEHPQPKPVDATPAPASTETAAAAPTPAPDPAAPAPAPVITPTAPAQ